LADPQSDNIEGEGIQKMAQHLGIDLLDPVFLVISLHFNAEKTGMFKK